MQLKSHEFFKLITVLYIVVFETFVVKCSKLQSLIQNTISKEQILTVQLVHDDVHQCDWDGIAQSIQLPLLSWSQRYPPDMAPNFNKNLLSLVCLREGHNENLLHSLADSLEFLRLTHIIFISSTSHNASELQKLTALCKAYDMLNYIVVYRDFELNSVYYTQQLFPQPTLIKRYYRNNGKSVLYPLARTPLNLHGRPIVVAADWSEPRSIVYSTPDGVDHMSGYMIKLVRAFADHVNGSLRFPYGSRKIYMRNLFALTRNRSIDMAVSLSNPKLEMNLYEYTYPFDISTWFTMLPTEADIPLKAVFFYVSRDWRFLCVTLLVWLLLLGLARAIQGPTEMPKLIINDMIWRAGLSQSFVLSTRCTRKEKLVVMVALFAGFMLCNIYLSYVNAMLVDLPSQPRIETFDDLLNSKLNILIASVELKALLSNKGEIFWSKYHECFVVMPSFEEFVNLRKSFNTSYGYMITSSLWPVFDQQQKYLSRRTFRASRSLIYDEFSLSSMPLQNNSIYKRDLDTFMMRLQDHGLQRFWLDSSLSDMVASKRITLHDFATKRQYEVIQLDDLYWIWVLYGGFNVCAMIVFVIEMWYFSVQCHH